MVPQSKTTLRRTSETTAPESRSGRIMNRKGSSWHALRARNTHLLLTGFDLLHHAKFSFVLSVDRPSTECRPITDRYIGQVSTNYRRSVGEMSAKCRGTKSYIGRDTSGTTIDPCLDRVSTHYRPTIDRVSTAISTPVSTDISVDTTHSKQDPFALHVFLAKFSLDVIVFSSNRLCTTCTYFTT